MSQNLQSKNLLANIDQAKKQSFSTAMQTLQTQESAFNTALENVQKDLRADFTKMSQELIQSCRQSNQETLTSLTEAMNSSLKSNLSLMTTLERQNEKVSEQIQHSQASLLTLQLNESELIRTLEQRYKQITAEALETLSESHKTHLRHHKVLTKVPTLILSALTLVLIVSLVPTFVLIDHFELWKKMFGILAMIVVLVVIVVLSWAWYSNSKGN